jgi:hypothetical protein
MVELIRFRLPLSRLADVIARLVSLLNNVDRPKFGGQDRDH